MMVEDNTGDRNQTYIAGTSFALAERFEISKFDGHNTRMTATGATWQGQYIRSPMKRSIEGRLVHPINAWGMSMQDLPGDEAW